jgi:hypothetical protein
MVENQSFTVGDVEPGDIEFDYSFQHVNISAAFQNPTIYDLEGILLNITFEVTNDSASENWFTVLDVTSADVNESIPESGQTIKANELGVIALNISQDYFVDIADFEEYFYLTPPWDLETLLGAAWEARITVGFTIDYAFRQYQVAASVVLGNNLILQGLGG